MSAVRAVLDGVVVAGTLKRRGLRPLLQDHSHLPPTDPSHARNVAVAVDAGLAVLPLGATCLRRSLTLLRELRRQGVGGTLHIGVRTGASGSIEAHAWVQVLDDVINDNVDVVATYTELSAGDAERLATRFV
jgi:hypothetical protein